MLRSKLRSDKSWQTHKSDDPSSLSVVIQGGCANRVRSDAPSSLSRSKSRHDLGRSPSHSAGSDSSDSDSASDTEEINFGSDTTFDISTIYDSGVSEMFSDDDTRQISGEEEISRSGEEASCFHLNEVSDVFSDDDTRILSGEEEGLFPISEVSEIFSDDEIVSASQGSVPSLASPLVGTSAPTLNNVTPTKTSALTPTLVPVTPADLHSVMDVEANGFEYDFTQMDHDVEACPSAFVSILAEKKLQGTTWYLVGVQEGSDERHYWKRYGDFVGFHNALLSSSQWRSPRMVPDLPAKGFLGISHVLNIGGFNVKRRAALEIYMKVVVAQANICGGEPEVFGFIGNGAGGQVYPGTASFA